MEEIHSDMKAMRVEMKAMRTELDEFRSEVRSEFDGLHKDVTSLRQTTDLIAVTLNGAVEDITFVKSRIGRIETDLDMALPLMRGLALETGELKRTVADFKVEVIRLRNDLGV